MFIPHKVESKMHADVGAAQIVEQAELLAVDMEGSPRGAGRPQSSGVHRQRR